jgi:shikimate kinase
MGGKAGGIGKQPRVVLVGMMGSGKSAVGGALSARTRWPFIDNDELLERTTGRTARDVLVSEGEPALRAAEARALRAAVRVPPPAIVATAAGTIMEAADRSVLDGAGFVVWLRAPADVLAARAAGGDHRPWLADDPVGWFRQVLREREPLYAQVADLEVDAARSDPAASADLILRALTAGQR